MDSSRSSSSSLQELESFELCRIRGRAPAAAGGGGNSNCNWLFFDPLAFYACRKGRITAVSGHDACGDPRLGYRSFVEAGHTLPYSSHLRVHGYRSDLALSQSLYKQRPKLGNGV